MVTVIGCTEFACAVRKVLVNDSWHLETYEDETQSIVNEERTIYVPVIDGEDIGEALALAMEANNTYIRMNENDCRVYTPATSYIIYEGEEARMYNFL